MVAVAGLVLVLTSRNWECFSPLTIGSPILDSEWGIEMGLDDEKRSEKTREKEERKQREDRKEEEGASV